MYNIEKLYERQEAINNLNQKLKGERKTHFEHYYLKKNIFTARFKFNEFMVTIS